MAQNYKQEAPATLSEAWQHGKRVGIELIEARKQMRELIAHRLQTCRLAARMTQQELAAKIDINHLTYRGYENCKSDIPIVYLVRLADEFGVSMDYLTGRTDDRTGNVTAPKEIATSSTDQRIAQLEKLVAQLISTQSGNG
jgi:transcriptional regulator with XRE-family HTH domain